MCWFSIKGSILRHKSRRPKLARKLASRGGGRQGRKEKQGVGENDAWQPPRPSSQTCRSPEKNERQRVHENLIFKNAPTEFVSLL